MDVKNWGYGGPTSTFLGKKSTYKWTRAVQTHSVQKSTVIASQLPLHSSVHICLVIIDGNPLRTSPSHWARCYTFWTEKLHLHCKIKGRSHNSCQPESKPSNGQSPVWLPVPWQLSASSQSRNCKSSLEMRPKPRNSPTIWITTLSSQRSEPLPSLSFPNTLPQP